MENSNFNDEVYFLDTGKNKVYFNILSDTKISCNHRIYTMPIEKFIDFIHTANELGLKAGKM